ncbi:MAG: PIN domain-containing protein [Verrucomicrobiaceae bacterium]|nr:PIN domain-containing protein [Verrucomicrobiaceae bacterium]
MPSPPIVLLDACVLYPAALRDLLMRLAVHELIQARWSEKIHEEWMTAVLRERPDLTLEQLERTRQLMDLHAGDCLVSGYEWRIENLSLPDENDRHVLAAAIEAEADAIVTWNLSDFPPATLVAQGIARWTPDDLLMQLLSTDEDAVVKLMRQHRASLRNPPKSAEEYLETLEQQRLSRSVQVLRRRLTEL